MRAFRTILFYSRRRTRKTAYYNSEEKGGAAGVLERFGRSTRAPKYRGAQAIRGRVEQIRGVVRRGER